ncbi:MAG: hypothetical protein B6244_04475 [Candidatus Cloacimonetes bacterium 4572_55]|nr:MAG: hypothetical protein B6244_04475 [Candidatus Cloacimonetes bacterium 4572_55]
MQALKKKGLLNSVQGVKGGYCLKENDPGRISLYSILSAIDGPVGLVYCLCEEERDRACNRHDNCNIQTMMVGIQQELINYLKKMFLSDVKKPKI